MRIFVTGGAGFICSHVTKHLLAREHEVAVVDDLLSTAKCENVQLDAAFCEADASNERRVADIFGQFELKALSHQAAQMDARRSVRKPDFDADFIVGGTSRRLENW